MRLNLLGEHHPPGRSQPLVPFQRPTVRFLLKPSRFSTRLMVEAPSLLPVSRSKKRCLSETVAIGIYSTSPSTSFSVV